MITLELFFLCLGLFVVGGWYITNQTMKTSYTDGLRDAVQLMDEGLLTYETYEEDGLLMYKIRITSDEE